MKPFSYKKGPPPPEYFCGICKADNCKLWRDSNTFHFRLFCLACAEAESGERLAISGRWASDQLVGLVPAVPCEDGSGLWGYSSVPDGGVTWWKQLPTAPSPWTPRAVPADDAMDQNAATQAFDEIAKAVGCPQWDYPGQLVRDVRALAARVAALETELAAEREQRFRSP